MNELPSQATSNSMAVVRYVALTIAVLFMGFSLYSMYQLQNRVADLDSRLKETESKFNKQIAKTHSELQSSSQELAQQVGMTQKQIAQRAAALQRQQKEAEERLSAEQQEQAQKLASASGEITGVKTEVGGVKTDVASTRSELEATKAKLEKTIGDLGVQTGLIARTRDDLEYLKHKGDRDYFEFTASKKQRTPVSTVSLELKKTDTKKQKYTLVVLADDKQIEKKDKSTGDVVQFLTGRDRMLYELVVFEVNKDKISGYISTPKNAPQPVSR